MNAWYTTLAMLSGFIHCRYEIMQSCWEFDPAARPSFSSLVQTQSLNLESLSDYMDVGAFSQESALQHSDSKPKLFVSQQEQCNVYV